MRAIYLLKAFILGVTIKGDYLIMKNQKNNIQEETHIERWEFVGNLTDLVYKWHGGCIIEIHNPGEEIACDCITTYGDDQGRRPNLQQVRESISRREEDYLAEIIGETGEEIAAAIF